MFKQILQYLAVVAVAWFALAIVGVLACVCFVGLMILGLMQ